MLCKHQASLDVQLMESQTLWMGEDHMVICSDSLPDAQTRECLYGMRMRQTATLIVGTVS